jgi:hypothetical protein
VTHCSDSTVGEEHRGGTLWNMPWYNLLSPCHSIPQAPRVPNSRRPTSKYESILKKDCFLLSKINNNNKRSEY